MFAIGGAAWIVCGLVGATGLLPVHVGATLCGLATLIIFAAPLNKHSRALTEEHPIDFEHLGERFGLLTIIVLGESFVKVLSELSAQDAGLDLYLDGGFVLLITCSIWWVYFDDVAGSEVREGRSKWIVWLYSHIPLQIAITATGVAVKKAVYFNFDEPAGDGYRYLLVGSMAAVYFAVAAIDSVTERREAKLSDRARINVRAASGIFLLVLGPAGATMSGGLFLLIVAGVGVANVLFDMAMAPFEEDEHAMHGVVTAAELHAAEEAAGKKEKRKRRDLSQTVRKGTPSDLRSDIYFYLIEGSWWRVVSVFTVAFLGSNIFFAALYLLDPAGVTGFSAEPGFTEAFHFSVQTMTTIGYGAMSPQTDFIHAVVMVEAAVGLVGVALMTGLVFAKLSRPNAGVLFSESMVQTVMHGQPHLVLRIGNTRGNDIVDARVAFTVLIEEKSPEGHYFRRLHDLKVARDRSPMFAMSWTVLHCIDEDSPLHGIDLTDPESPILAYVVTMVGHDGTYGQTNYARYTYECDEVKVGHRFVDIIHELPDGRLMVDYSKFHLTRPDTQA